MINMLRALMDREYSGTDGQYKQRDEHPKEEPKKYYRSKKKKSDRNLKNAFDEFINRLNTAEETISEAIS